MTRYFKYSFSFLFVLALISCDPEIGPAIDFSEAVETVELIEPIPAPEERRTFLMEFTGGACTNCPRAAEAVQTILANHPDTFVPVGMHCKDIGITWDPAPNHIQDFTLDDGATYFSNFGGFAIPCAAADLFQFPEFDTVIINPTVVVNQLEWEGFHEQRLLVPNPVNLLVRGSIVDEVLQVSAEIVFTEDVSEDLYITVFVVESHIIDAQLLPDGTLDEQYEHNHIVRQVLTPTTGSILANGSEKVAGTKVTRNFSVEEIPGAWVRENLEFAAIVHRSGNSLEVLQAAKGKIQ